MSEKSKFTAKNRLTIEALASLPEQHQEHVRTILTVVDEMGLCAWYDTERYGLLLGTKKRGPLNLGAPLWVKDGGEAENVVTMLKLMRTLYGLDPDIDLGSRLSALEDLLESMLSAASGENPVAQRYAIKKAGTLGSETLAIKVNPSPEQIMEIYRDLQAQFIAEGVEFEIIEKRMCAQYFNPRSRRHAIIYTACVDDLRKVQTTLRDLQKRRLARAA